MVGRGVVCIRTWVEEIGHCVIPIRFFKKFFWGENESLQSLQFAMYIIR